MDLVIYEYNGEKYDGENVICAYNNCYSIPQKHNNIYIGENLYEVVADPCFSFEKNTVWLFAKRIF